MVALSLSLAGMMPSHTTHWLVLVAEAIQLSLQISPTLTTILQVCVAYFILTWLSGSLAVLRTKGYGMHTVVVLGVNKRKSPDSWRITFLFNRRLGTREIRTCSRGSLAGLCYSECRFDGIARHVWTVWRLEKVDFNAWRNKRLPTNFSFGSVWLFRRFRGLWWWWLWWWWWWW